MKNKIAVIIVDMQNFFLKNFAPSVRDTLISNQIKIIDLCVKKKIPFIIFEYRGEKENRGKTIQKITKRVRNAQKEIIIKENNGGFTKTQLDTKLKELNIKEFLVIGINANGCIQDTVIGGLNRGYKIITSKGVMANSFRKDLELSKRNQDWFIKNTTFFENPKNLIKYLTK